MKSIFFDLLLIFQTILILAIDYKLNSNNKCLFVIKSNSNYNHNVMS